MIYLVSLGSSIAKQQVILQIEILVMFVPLGFLFVELYKTIREKNFSIVAKRIIFYVFIFGFAALFITRFEYLPARNFTVKTVFGDPIAGITVCVIEGHLFETHGGSDISREKKYCDKTNVEGEAHIGQKIYFAEEKAKGIVVLVNIINVGIEINNNFNYEILTINKYKQTENFYLAPISSQTIDYKKCFSIKDADLKSICLRHSIFYSAVKNQDGEICENYDLVNIPRDVNWGLNRSILKNDCYAISAILKNDPAYCSKMGDYGKTGCYLDLGREDLCRNAHTDDDNVDDKNCADNNTQGEYNIKKYGIGITKNIANYLCTDLIFRSEAVEEYRNLFCENQPKSTLLFPISL